MIFYFMLDSVSRVVGRGVTSPVTPLPKGAVSVPRETYEGAAHHDKVYRYEAGVLTEE